LRPVGGAAWASFHDETQNVASLPRSTAHTPTSSLVTPGNDDLTSSAGRAEGIFLSILIASFQLLPCALLSDRLHLPGWQVLQQSQNVHFGLINLFNIINKWDEEARFQAPERFFYIES
jgi:hypothetical protein